MTISVVDRLVPTISLKGASHMAAFLPLLLTLNITDFDARREEITTQLVEAAENSGFFMLIDHGISIEEINYQFGISKSFFDQTKDVKSRTPYDLNFGLGWEYKAQTRRLTGTDQKESLWLSHSSTWPSEEDVPGFRESTKSFMNKCGVVSHKVCKLTYT